MAHDVFICHSSKDRTIANAVCSTLEQNRIRCWIGYRRRSGTRMVAPKVSRVLEEREVVGAQEQRTALHHHLEERLHERLPWHEGTQAG